MGKLNNLTGMTFGRLQVIKRAGSNKNKQALWLCECQCEKKTKLIVIGSDLLRGHTQSCGCLQREIVCNIKTKHGQSFTALHNIWTNMKQRVCNKKCEAYQNYGGRGIKICDEWINSFESFYTWATNNGYKEGLTIERKNVNGDYCPENCTWASKLTQTRNRRNTQQVYYKNELKPLSQWCDELNLPYNTIRARINTYHWSIEKAFTTPIRRKKS